MTCDEIFERLQEVLVDALGVDEDEVLPGAVLTRALGDESIALLDIVFKLEQAFDFKIDQGELFPDNVVQDPEFVQNGMVTAKGIATLKERLPHADFSELEADPQVTRVGEIFTVDAVVNFVERKQTAVGS